MVKSAIAVLVGSIIVFFWGFLSWTFMGWHEPKNFKNPDEVAAVIKKNAPDHGMYALPGKNEKGEVEAEAMEKGPFMMAVIRPGSNDGYSFAFSTLVNWLTAIIGCVALVAIMRLASNRFSKMALIAFLTSIFLGITAALPALNLSEYPMSKVQAIFVDSMISWSLAGIAMAYVLTFTPKKS